jgi:hypothetical protein
MAVASAAGAEMGALLFNVNERVNIRNILAEMENQQPATPLQTYNTIAHTKLRGTCKQQCRKAIDICLYWVRNCTVQNQFDIVWGPSAQNIGDYFTKHHTPAHHKGICKMYLHDDSSPKYIPQHMQNIRKGVLILQYLPTRQSGIMQTQPWPVHIAQPSIGNA